MKKVYVVTQGQYSDYSICAVFDSKSLAKKYCRSFQGGYSSPEIEEWQLNPHEIGLRDGYKPYFIRMDRDGNTTELRESDSTYGFSEDEYAAGFDINKRMYLHCFARDEAHAMKIANERRLALLAAGEWQ